MRIEQPQALVAMEAAQQIGPSLRSAVCPIALLKNANRICNIMRLAVVVRPKDVD